MGLISNEQERCCKVTLSQVDDGEGGQTTVYARGERFMAVVAPASSTIDMKRIADKEISAKAVRIFYPNNITLNLNDVFEDASGQAYQITVSGFKSAKSASIQYSLAYAEKWEVPPNEFTE